MTVRRRSVRNNARKRALAAVKNMTAEDVTFWNGRVLKIAINISLELQPFHQTTGPDIDRCGERNDLRQLQRLKSKRECLTSCAVRQATPPKLLTKPPANFRARRE